MEKPAYQCAFADARLEALVDEFKAVLVDLETLELVLNNGWFVLLKKCYIDHQLRETGKMVDM